MDGKYKVLFATFIPYLTICGGLWNWAFWSTFDINIFVFIDASDIVKSFILPLLSASIFFILGQVFRWFFLANIFPYGGGAGTTTGEFLKRHTKLFAFGWLTLIVTLIAINDSPYRWISAVWMLLPLLSIPLMETGFLADTFPNRDLRIIVLTTLIMVPLLSFGQGKSQGEKILKNLDYKTIDRELIKQLHEADTSTYKFLGVGGEFIFGISLDNRRVILIKRSELNSIITID